MTTIENTIARLQTITVELNDLASALYRPGGSAEHDAAVRASESVRWLAETLERRAAAERPGR